MKTKLIALCRQLFPAAAHQTPDLPVKRTPEQWDALTPAGRRILDWDGPIRSLRGTPMPLGQFLQLRRECTVMPAR